jgi:hypothetical protein
LVGVDVGGTTVGVAVGGTEVSVGGIMVGVAVGGIEVSVGGTRVSVGSSGIVVDWLRTQPTTRTERVMMGIITLWSVDMILQPFPSRLELAGLRSRFSH